MEFLLLAVARPSGLWEWLILYVLRFIENYGLRVVFLVVMLKLILFPIDLFQRKSGIDNAKKMEAMKPEMDALKEQFGDDKATLSQKQMALQKKYKYRPFTACLPLIITLVIFITLFNGFRVISSYQNVQTIENLYGTYVTYYDKNTGNTCLTLPELQSNLDELYFLDVKGKYDSLENPDYAFDPENTEQLEKLLPRAPYNAVPGDLSGINNSREVIARGKRYAGQKAVLAQYESEEKEPFLFVKNIWRADTWNNPIPSKSEMEASIKHKKIKIDSKVQEALISEYPSYMKLVTDNYKGKWNGYMIWVVLAVGLSFLQQIITRKQQKGQDMGSGQMGTTMKIMMWVMPIMMGVFAFTSAASFTVYIVVNTAMGILTNLGATGIVKLMDKNKHVKIEKEIQSTGVRSVRGMKKK